MFLGDYYKRVSRIEHDSMYIFIENIEQRFIRKILNNNLITCSSRGIVENEIVGLGKIWPLQNEGTCKILRVKIAFHHNRSLSTYKRKDYLRGNI